MDHLAPAPSSTGDTGYGIASDGARPMFTARLRLPRLAPVGSRDSQILGSITLFLALFGLLMVLSSSSVEAGRTSGDPYSDFSRQAIAGVAGIALMLIASRFTRRFWMRASPVVFVATIVLQAVTALTPLGRSVNGNQNWIVVGGFSLQPSEFVKFGLVLMLATFFARRPAGRLTIVGMLPIAAVAAIAIVVVLAGRDLGTCLIIGAMVLGGMFFAGVRLPVIGLSALLAGGAFWLAAASRGSRVERLGAWTGGCGHDLLGTCWQTTQATWALAAGGVWGVGIGDSTSKWFWLPEADNDFILAVIGEETGLVGLSVLLALFVALAIAFLRITRSADPFTRAAAGATLAWVVGQAFANIAVVLGFAPVFGVPLPFISSGGSSMVANLIAVGCVMSLARGAAAASSSGRPATTTVAAGHPSLAGGRSRVVPIRQSSAEMPIARAVR